MSTGRVLAISGGVGGAKLSLGLYRALPANTLGVIVNTGDDFTHLDLHISPDIDTLVYTLAAIVDTTTGWGRDNETWHCLDELEALGESTWFRLGDRDLAMHLARTLSVRNGKTLTQFTSEVAERLGVRAKIMPTSDDPIRTVVQTSDGPLDFQEYFVRRQCEPAVTSLEYAGAESAGISEDALCWLDYPDLEAIVICPSNPYLSIAPVLAAGDLRRRICDNPAPVVAVSPLVGGQAVKGPTAKIMRELGLNVTNATIAEYYEGIIDGFIIDQGDESDAGWIEKNVVPCVCTKTLMNSDEDKVQLARDTLEFAGMLNHQSRHR